MFKFFTALLIKYTWDFYVIILMVQRQIKILSDLYLYWKKIVIENERIRIFWLNLLEILSWDTQFRILLEFLLRNSKIY